VHQTALEQGLVGDRIAQVDRAVREDRDGAPGPRDPRVAKQIEKYGRQPAGIEVRLGIELGLDEDERQIRPAWRGQQDAVEAKGGVCLTSSAWSR